MAESRSPRRERSRSPPRRERSRSPPRRERSRSPPRRERYCSPPRRLRDRSRSRQDYLLSFRSACMATLPCPSETCEIDQCSDPEANHNNMSHRDRIRRSRSPPRRRYSRSRSTPPRRDRSRSPLRERSPAPPGCLLFVAGFTFITEEKDLEKKFEKVGGVKTSRVVKDPRGQSRGFGFVEMKTAQDAEAAVRELSGIDWNGRKILVEVAKRGA